MKKIRGSSLGGIVRAARLERGLTLADLGKKAGITEGAVSHIECGRRAEPRTLRKLAHQLGVDPDLLVVAAGVPPDWLCRRMVLHPGEVLRAFNKMRPRAAGGKR